MPGKHRPNIVFVLADDLAKWALGCYGNHEIHTPNIDALADAGIRFTDFYCTSPVCSPSRASLLTGRMPSSHGVQDWVRGGNGDDGVPVEYLQGLDTYTDVLAANGYVCGISGKWHLGNSPRPQHGFTHWFVYPSGGGTYNDASMYRGSERVRTDGYVTDVITDDAIEFMRRHAAGASPFYLSVNFTAPHSPWVDQHPRELVELYSDCAFTTCPQENRHPWSGHHPIEMSNTDLHASSARSKVTVWDHLRGYFAAVTALDRAVGRIRAEIADLGIEQETMIVFTSDNGFNCGQHGIWGKGNATTPQNMYDTSVQVPAIVSYPGTVTPGTSEEMLSGYDVMPTILELLDLGDDLPDGLPGRSFLDVLTTGTATKERPVVVYDEYGPTRMIRTRRWKYVHRYPYGPHELFDMVDDPGERRNLLEDEALWDEDVPKLAAELRSELGAWFERYSDTRLDGRVQAVTGRGQLGRIDGPGASAFHGPETQKTL